MPSLPTLTVTQAQLDRATTAFGDAATYKAWLKARVVEYVVQAEARTIDETNNAAKATKLAATRDGFASAN